MCGTEQRCEKQSDCGVHVAQLRRLVCFLMLWCFFLSVGLAISIWLCFFLIQRVPNIPVTVPPTTLSTPSTSLTSCKMNQEIITYDYVDTGSNGDGKLRWQMSDNNEKGTTLVVEEDSHYFLYLQVTLDSRNDSHMNQSYKIYVEKNGEKIMEGSINKSQLSSGFMGKGFLLTSGTKLTVICKPSAQLNVKATYLGMIKLPKS